MVYCESCGAANETITEKCFVCLQPFIDTEELEIVSVKTPADTQSENTPALLQGRYQLLKEVGTGGFGAVYKAIDTQFDNRIVAIKEIRLQGLKPHEIIDATDTFNREVNILTDLRHPNLPRVYDHFTSPEHWYLVMDFIDGQTLEAYLDTRGRRLPLAEVFTLGIQICTVLDYLHTRQPAIIFRDLKPTNIMITSNKQVYLIDFGAARYFKAGRAKDTIAFGSPGYAAPEQYGKAQTTARSDIYSLGATLHEALTGKDPAEDPFHFAPVHVTGKAIPPDLDALIQRMVEMDMSKRPTSAATIKAELWRISTQHTQRLYAQPAAPSSPYSIPPYRPNFGVGQPPPASWAQSAPSVQQAQMQLGFTPTPAPRKQVFSRRAATSMIILGIASVALLENVRTLWNPPYGQSQPPPGPMMPGFDIIPQGSFTYHTDTVTSLDWSPHGSSIASGSLDKTLRVWKQDFDGIDTIHTMPNGVQAVGWSPDGSYIAAASAGKTGELQIWNASASGGDKPLLTASQPSSGAINALAWSPITQSDGHSIAIGSDDGKVRVMHEGTFLSNGMNTTTIYDGPKGPLLSLAWSPDGNYLAGGSADATVQIWQAINSNGSSVFSPAFVFSQHTDRVTALIWTSNQNAIISGSADMSVKVWDINNGINVLQSYVMSSPVSALALSSQNLLAIGTEDGKITLYNLFGSDQPFKTFNSSRQAIRSIVWSPDSSSLVIGGDDRQASIWNIRPQYDNWQGGDHDHPHWGG